jgi:hypothetical protein
LQDSAILHVPEPPDLGARSFPPPLYTPFAERV